VPVGFDEGVSGVCHHSSPWFNNTSPKAHDTVTMYDIQCTYRSLSSGL
jgi:hypothetical protein